MLTLSTQLLASIDAGRVLVVPDAKRAAAIRLAHAIAQAERGHTLWRTPDILAWRAWLDRELVAASASGLRVPRVLDDIEEWLIWRDSALDAARGLGVETSDALIEALRRAAVVAAEWRLSSAALARGAHAEALWLARSLRDFDARCRDLDAGTMTQIAAQLDHRCAAPVDLAAFAGLTPAERAILERWRTAGSDIQHVDCAGARGDVRVARCADPAHELAAAAHWARARLLADPRCRLLVVVPELQAQRAVIERTFAVALNASPDDIANYAVASPERLAHAPIVRHLLTALRLSRAPLDFDVVSAWLRGTHWREPDGAARARLDLWLREHLSVRVAWQDLAAALAAVPALLARPASQLRRRLQDFETALDATRPARAGVWSARIAAAIQGLGLAGLENSVVRVAYHRFVEVLNELAALETSGGELACGHAVEWLERLVARAAFDVSPVDCAVTVTDALVGPAVRYDGIWVCDLRAGSWPRAVRRDPFIPPNLQIAAGMPCASAAARLTEARALLGAWRRATGELVVSWPQSVDDCEQAPSALLAGIATFDAASPPTTAQILHASRAIEAYEDPDGAPWQGGRTVPAGARSVDHQIRCAFRAYAELRLAAVPLERPRPGLDPRDRGRLMHRVLELMWREIESSSELVARRGAALGALIELAAERAGGELLAEQPGEERARALRREQRRATRLVASLCEIEAGRTPFTVVAREARHTIECEGVRLHVRIDRVDRLADGSLALIDYKTGKPGRQEWLGTRPSQPQLLVYLRALEEARVSALANAHLTAERVAFRGVADTAGRLPQLVALGAEAWGVQVHAWRGIVERAVREFVDGRALRDPIEGACDTCHLHAFCRIGDAAAMGQGT